jgi:hypothetical protein
MSYVRIADIPVLIISALIGLPILTVLIPFWIEKKLNPNFLLIVIGLLIWVSTSIGQFVWKRIKPGQSR